MEESESTAKYERPYTKCCANQIKAHNKKVEHIWHKTVKMEMIQ